MQQVVPVGQEFERALWIAQAIAAQAPLAVVATRHSVRKALEHGPLVAALDFVAVQQGLSCSADAAEGVLSFIEKLTAKFVGR